MTADTLHRNAETVGADTPARSAPAPSARREMSCDIAVVGAGSGGLSVAAGAAQLGLNVVLFERGEMGGDCLNYGCVPSKALIAAGKRAHALRTADTFGIAPTEPQVDWLKVREHVRGVIAAIAPVDSQERFEGLGVTVIREHARFASEKTLVSDSTQVTARRIVIATGSSAFVPPIPGLETTPYLTNETVFDLDVLPRRLLILGGGPIGIELAQAFRRLGSEVAVIEAAAPLGRIDPEIAQVALERVHAEGVEICAGEKAVGVAASADGGVAVTTEDAQGAQRTLTGSHLLVAVGRRPNLDGLDLDAGHVAFTKAGVVVKPNLRSATNGRVWAVGDIAGQGQFTHLAGWHASVFVRNALFKTRSRADSLPIPEVTYCDPEVAHIGLTEAQAIDQRGDSNVTVSRWGWEHNDRAQAERDIEGFGKIITDKKGRILGASIVGDSAGEVIQLVGVAMSNGLTIKALTNYVSPYPTRGELAKRMAGAYYTPIVFSGKAKALVGLLQKIP